MVRRKRHFVFASAISPGEKDGGGGGERESVVRSKKGKVCVQLCCVRNLYCGGVFTV